MVCCAPNRSIFRLFFIHIFLVFHSVSVWERRKLSPVTHWNTAGFSSIASVWFVISDRDVHIDPSQQDFSLLRACVRMWFSVLCTVIPFVIHTFFNISIGLEAISHVKQIFHQNSLLFWSVTKSSMSVLAVTVLEYFAYACVTWKIYKLVGHKLKFVCDVNQWTEY